MFWQSPSSSQRFQAQRDEEFARVLAREEAENGEDAQYLELQSQMFGEFARQKRKRRREDEDDYEDDQENHRDKRRRQVDEDYEAALRLHTEMNGEPFKGFGAPLNLTDHADMLEQEGSDPGDGPGTEFFDSSAGLKDHRNQHSGVRVDKMAEEDTEPDPMAESTADAARRAASKKHPPTATCVACSDDYEWDELVKAPCEHTYCGECVSELFRRSMTDESLFPPRCCRQALPVDKVRPFLGVPLTNEFEQKAVELSTHNRTYCHDPHCSAFIPAANIIADVGQCLYCLKRTCSMCKATAHTGDCPEDTALQQVMETAQEQGWRRCYCGRIIEITQGCNHMTCPCGHKFCYLCGRRWKTCQCSQYERHRLFERAAILADRDPHAAHRRRRHPPPRPRTMHRPPFRENPTAESQFGVVTAETPRDRLIQTWADRLVQNTNCQHPLKWRGVRGPGEHTPCELCHRHRARLNSCRYCGLVACYPCRRNRL